MQRVIGSEVYQAQYGVGKIVDAKVGNDDVSTTNYCVEFTAGFQKSVAGNELFDSYLDFAERDAADYHR